jgi:hypothetical protein
MSEDKQLPYTGKISHIHRKEGRKEGRKCVL